MQANQLTTVQRQDLVVEHMDMARRMARKYARRVPKSFGREELESAAMLGLTEAANRFDAGRGEPFVAYAAKRVRGAVLDELRRRDSLTRRCRQKARRLASAAHEVEGEKGRAATVDEMAHSMGLSTAEVLQVQIHSQGVSFVPLDDLRDSAPAHDSGPSIDEQVDMQRRAVALAGALRRLPERELMVLSMYYQDGLTQREIGSILDVSESRVCQLRARSLRTLKTALSPSPSEE